MAGLIASAGIVYLALAWMAAEAIVVIIVRKKTGRGLTALDLAGNLLAGLALLMALRAAILGLAWPQIAGFLLLALFAHAWDLRRRWTAQ
jgi:hypothetical protein